MPNNNQAMLYRFLRMEGNVDDVTRTVDISFSSEAPVRRFDWGKCRLMKFLAMMMVMQT